MPLRDKINEAIVKAKTDDRLSALAKRIFILQKAIREMNNKAGAFLNSPPIKLMNISEMKQGQIKLINKNKGLKHGQV